MPPVVAFVVANWVAVLAVGSALAAGFAMIAAKKAGAGGESQFNQQQMVRSSNEPRRGIYGKAMVSGPLMFIGETGEDREWLYMVIAIAGHRTDGCELVKLDDEICWQNGSYSNNYASHVKLKYYDGTQTRADSELVSKFNGWTSNHVGHGISYLRIGIKHDQDKFPSGIPNVKMLVRGKPVYDPRDSSQNANDESTWKYSTNWGLCVLDYVKNTSGVGATPQEINLDSFIAAANLSDEYVEIKPGEFEKRYELNGTFAFDQTPKEIVEGLLSAGAGQLIYTHGVYSLQGGAYYGPAELTLDDSSLRADMQLNPLTDRSDVCNAVRGTFVDPNNFWQSVDFPPVENDYYRNKDQGEYIDHDIDLENVISIYQAQRLAKIHLERSRAGFTINFPAKLGIGFQCWPGRVVKLNFPYLGLNNKEFEVMSFNLKEKGVDLVLKETAPEIYDWALGEATSRDLTPNSDLPDPRNVPTVKGLAYTAHEDHANFLGELTWNAPANNSGYRYRIGIFNGQGGLVYQDDSNLPKKLVPKIDSGFYTAKVWAINSFGYLSKTPAEITLNSNAPASVIGIDFDIGTLSLTIKPSVNGEIAQTTVFEVRGGLGDAFEDSELLGSGKTVVWPDRHPNTQYFLWARTVNNQGQSNWFGPVSTRTSSDGSAVQALVGEFDFDNYTWFAWADDDQGAGFTTNEADKDGKAYFGIATGKDNETPSGNWQEYEWSKKFTEIGDVFTDEEQQQLDDVMNGVIPGTSQQMLSAQQALNNPQLNNDLMTALDLLNNGIDAGALGGETPAGAQGKADAAVAKSGYQSGSHVVNDFIGIKGQFFEYKFAPVSTNDISNIILRIDQRDLEIAIEIRVNDHQLTASINGTDNVRHWKQWVVPSSMLNSDSDNIVRIGHRSDQADDWGYIYQVYLGKETDSSTQVSEKAAIAKTQAVNDIAAGNFTAQVGLIQKLIANQALFNEVNARFGLFGGLAANAIAANSISTKHLTVANTDNICTNGQFKEGNAGWSSHVSVVEKSFPDAYGGTNKTGLVNNIRDTHFLKNFDIREGEKYFLSAYAYHYLNPTADLRLGLQVEYSDGSYQWPTFLLRGRSKRDDVNKSDGIITIVQKANGIKPVKATIFVQMNGSSGQMGGGYFFSNIYCRKMADAKLIVDGAVTATKVAANAIRAEHVLADSALINKLVATQALFDSLVARIATFGGLTANSISAGAIQGQHIAAGQKISSPVMVGGQVQLIGSAYMKVSSSTPFGPDGLVEWYGPKLMSGSNPNWNSLRKSNAITYLSANGDAYFGGSLSAGVLRTAVTNSLKRNYGNNSYPVIIGPFSTNGRRKTVVVSYSMSASSQTSDSSGNITQPSLSWQLQRRIGTGDWSTVSSGRFSGTTTRNYEAEISRYVIAESCEGSSTYTDNSSSTSDFQYRIRVTGQARYHSENSVKSQLLTLTSTEQ